LQIIHNFIVFSNLFVISFFETTSTNKLNILNILDFMKNGERISLDLNIVSTPDDREFHKKELDKNYSAKYRNLKKIALFCLKCNGFMVY